MFLDEEERKKLEARKTAMDMMLELMAKFGDLNAIATKKFADIMELVSTIKNDDILDDEDNMKEFIGLLEQFETILKDFANEKNIKI